MAQVADRKGPAERSETERRITVAGSRLWAVVVAFFYMSWVFAYLYLKTVNSNGKWHPPGSSDLHVWFGVLILALVVLSLVAYVRSMTQLKRGELVGWQASALVALVLGVLAAAATIWQLAVLGFTPVSSAFASVFVGWTAMTIVTTLTAMYWLEVLLAQVFRERGGTVSDEALTASIAPSAQGFQFYWATLVVVQVIWFVLLYVIG